MRAVCAFPGLRAAPGIRFSVLLAALLTFLLAVASRISAFTQVDIALRRAHKDVSASSLSHFASVFRLRIRMAFETGGLFFARDPRGRSGVFDRSGFMRDSCDRDGTRDQKFSGAKLGELHSFLDFEKAPLESSVHVCIPRDA